MPYTLGWWLFASAAIASGLATAAFLKRADRAALFLSCYQMGVALVCGGYAFELMSSTLEVKYVWVIVRYIGWSFYTIALPFFILWYTRANIRLPKSLSYVIYAVPVIFFFLLLTSPIHHLYYDKIWLDFSAGFPMFAKTNGPLYLAYHAYSIILHIILVGVVFRSASLTRHIYRVQAVSLIIGIIFPLIADIFYAAGVRPIQYLNVTPFSYLITGVIFSWAFARFRGMELRPIALDFTFNRIPLALVVIDPLGYVVDLNHAALRLFNLNGIYRGAKRVEQICQSWPEFAQLIQSLQPGETREIVRGDGHVRSVYSLEKTSLERGLGEYLGSLLIIQDITAKVDADQRRVEQQRALSALEERERLARELHDSIGQVVGYLNLQTQNALLLLETGQNGLAQATLARMAEVVGETQGDMRELLLGMRQEFSQAADFYAELEKYIHEFSRVYAIPIRLRLPDPSSRPALEPGVEVHLLRIVQEALSNIRKHAQARQVNILFNFELESVQAIIEDNGTGFDPQHPVEGETPHFGLNIMHERAAEMQGRLQIISAPGLGTRVIISAPLAPTQISTEKTSGWRVVIADDHPLFRDGLKNLLVARGMEVVAVACNGAEAIDFCLRFHPDVLVLDIQMPGMDGIQVAAEVNRQAPAVRILMLTMSIDEALIMRAFRAGASGYLLKDLKAEDFLASLESLMKGETPLPAGVAEGMLKEIAARAETPLEDALNERQMEILRLMALRLTYVQIGERLHLSESTIKYHAAQIMDKLHVSGRGQALAEAANRGLVERRTPKH